MGMVVTGHRWHKLGSYSPERAQLLYSIAREMVNHWAPARVYLGLAEGWDLAVAKACIDLKVPFHAYTPYDGRQQLLQVCPEEHELWHVAYHGADLTVHATQRQGDLVVSRETLSLYRNNLMLNDCLHSFPRQLLLGALWDGETKSGTYSCVQAAKGKGYDVLNLWNHYAEEVV